VIASGLNRGEKVVVEGVQKVRSGAKVKPRPFAPASPPATQG
jgi:hypothetical protein